MVPKRFGMKQFAPVSVVQSNAQTTSSGMMLTANVSALQKLAMMEKHGTLRNVFANASLMNARMILTTITSLTEKNALANVTHLLLLVKKDSSTIPIAAHASAHQKNVHLLPSGTKSTALVFAKLRSAQQIPTGDLILKMKTTAAASANLTIAQKINIGMKPFAIAFAPHKNAQINISGTLSSVDADVLHKTAAARPTTQLMTLRLVLAFVLKTQLNHVQITNILIMFLANASVLPTNVQKTITGIQESATASPSIASAQLHSISISIQKLANAWFNLAP